VSGAFVHAFKSLFEHYSDIPIDIEFCGKPYPIQYTYAEELFRKNAIARGLLPPTKCFGIGDNPKSDIRGANRAGGHWRSVLVRTGVFQGGENDAEDPADFVVRDVLEAVRLIEDLALQERTN
jgi:ribonucleotide monophosphatase NagD (HAD superfamily)